MTFPAKMAPQPAPRLAEALRHGVEFVVCLAILVGLFRTFVVEGYVIETGSMAPCLLGRHVNATCPQCRTEFAVDDHSETTYAVCPNCTCETVPVVDLPHDDGDQLLVHRAAFDFRSPRRWEVIVFRNPFRPRQAFVKRVVGLPGDRIEISDGDVYANGARVLRSLDIQRAMKILVHDVRKPVSDSADWRPRWTIDAVATANTTTANTATSPSSGTTSSGSPSPESKSDWSADGSVFRFKQNGKANDWQWVTYRHWIRRGGTVGTSVPLSAWPAGLPDLDFTDRPLRFDAARKQLVAETALPPIVRDRFTTSEWPDLFRRAVLQLFDASHIAPIGDLCSYNSGSQLAGQHDVRDLFLSATVTVRQPDSKLAIQLDNGARLIRAELNFAAKSISLIDMETGKQLAMQTIPSDLINVTNNTRFELECSTFDGQFVLAINRRSVIREPISTETGDPGATPWQPLRIGAMSGEIEVSDLAIYRDVYYTTGQGKRGSRGPVLLGDDEFFVLGDNSPASQDMRDWPNSLAVRSQDLLGKPFLVHLPSRRRRVEWGNRRWDLRIPEFSRVRYIR